MEFFYIIVSVIAVVVLILVLTFIGLMIKNGNKTQTFPPNTAQCPDLWIPDGSFCHYNGGNNGNYNGFTTTTNTNTIVYDKTPPFFTYGGLINTGSTTINTSDPQWETTGTSSNCAKKKWATSNNIQWSGITQLNSC